MDFILTHQEIETGQEKYMYIGPKMPRVLLYNEREYRCRSFWAIGQKIIWLDIERDNGYGTVQAQVTPSELKPLYDIGISDNPRLSKWIEKGIPLRERTAAFKLNLSRGGKRP